MLELTSSNEATQREHLFINYASEDYVLAEWLTLRLTAEGYRVWCDRVKLLGGESYPSDVDLAIKDSTFRVLSLLSKHSIKKRNPLKERTLALKISEERKIDFVIPLNVDGLSPTELDWMTSDLTFIPFYRSWADGLARLLKKLAQIQAPRKMRQGRESVALWATAQENVVEKQERIWSNILPITHVPDFVIQYAVDEEDLKLLKSTWPFYQIENEVWAFGPPTDSAANITEVGRISWRDHEKIIHAKAVDVISYLLSRALFLHCLKKGMTPSSDGPGIYFGRGLLPQNKLHFRTYDGKSTYVKAVGLRTFRIAKDETEKSSYHLAPIFKPLMSRFGEPCYQLNLGVVWTDIHGMEYPRGKSNRRRRKLTRNWWNYQWLSRIMAIISWVTDGGTNCDILSTINGKVTIGTAPLDTASPFGIDEETLGPKNTEEDESEVLEDLSEDETEDEDYDSYE